jgi:HSP20 family protein
VRTWSPLHELDTFQQEMNRLFDWTFGGAGDRSFFEEAWNPATDVIEEEDRFRVRVDLPGMRREEIEVTVNGEVLTITGEKKRDAETKEKNVYRSERAFGKFSRTLRLPSAVDAERVEASYRDGVLEVSIPKSQEARARVVTVKS